MVEEYGGQIVLLKIHLLLLYHPKEEEDVYSCEGYLGPRPASERDEDDGILPTPSQRDIHDPVSMVHPCMPGRCGLVMYTWNLGTPPPILQCMHSLQ